MKKKVASALAKRDETMAERFEAEYHGETIEELNDYFRKVLTSAPINTMDERSVLMDDHDEVVWMRYFRSHVIDTVVNFQLI